MTNIASSLQNILTASGWSKWATWLPESRSAWACSSSVSSPIIHISAVVAQCPAVSCLPKQHMSFSRISSKLHFRGLHILSYTTSTKHHSRHGKPCILAFKSYRWNGCRLSMWRLIIFLTSAFSEKKFQGLNRSFMLEIKRNVLSLFQSQQRRYRHVQCPPWAFRAAFVEQGVWHLLRQTASGNTGVQESGYTHAGEMTLFDCKHQRVCTGLLGEDVWCWLVFMLVLEGKYFDSHALPFRAIAFWCGIHHCDMVPPCELSSWPFELLVLILCGMYHTDRSCRVNVAPNRSHSMEATPKSGDANTRNNQMQAWRWFSLAAMYITKAAIWICPFRKVKDFRVAEKARCKLCVRALRIQMNFELGFCHT